MRKSWEMSQQRRKEKGGKRKEERKFKNNETVKILEDKRDIWYRDIAEIITQVITGIQFLNNGVLYFYIISILFRH